MKIPRKVYYPRTNGEDKVLTANTERELENLLSIGWKLEPSKA